jgi:hypothetical protein
MSSASVSNEHGRKVDGGQRMAQSYEGQQIAQPCPLSVFHLARTLLAKAGNVLQELDNNRAAGRRGGLDVSIAGKREEAGLLVRL